MSSSPLRLPRYRDLPGIAVEAFEGAIRVFVADTGNRRLRMLTLP